MRRSVAAAMRRGEGAGRARPSGAAWQVRAAKRWGMGKAARCRGATVNFRAAVSVPAPAAGR
jgi:hypothetical protein